LRLDEVDAEEDGEQGYKDLAGRLGRIRDHVYVVMSSGVIARGSFEWVHLEDVLREVHGGHVYHCRRVNGYPWMRIV